MLHSVRQLFRPFFQECMLLLYCDDTLAWLNLIFLSIPSPDNLLIRHSITGSTRTTLKCLLTSHVLFVFFLSLFSVCLCFQRLVPAGATAHVLTFWGVKSKIQLRKHSDEPSIASVPSVLVYLLRLYHALNKHVNNTWMVPQSISRDFSVSNWKKKSNVCRALLPLNCSVCSSIQKVFPSGVMTIRWHWKHKTPI